jgi:membrane fusion protein, multidrug efflux system
MTNKQKYMNNILKISFAAIIAVSLVACGAGAKDKKGEAGDIKAKLEKLKKEKNTLDADIRKLEDELAKVDPTAASQVQKLVSVDTLRVQDFFHYIELQGKIGSDGVAYVSPTGQPGIVTAIYVKTGQKVGKGQIVAKLDDALARQTLISAQQKIGVVKTRLAQAQTIYERYQNLWKQNIGAEINVINAKAEVDATAAELRAAQAGIAQAQEAVNMSNVRAGISGTVEQVNVRIGETFTGRTPDQRNAQILIVNSGSNKVEVPVPDNYVARVKKGDKVLIEVKETGKPAYESVINMVGGAIDPVTRAFMVEAKLPSDPLLRPNQIATMKILDYAAKAAVAVPINVVQTDENNKYVYVMEKAGDKMVARKKVVNVGEAYNGLIEIKSGLSGGELIITEGYQTVYDGQSIKTVR